MSDNVTLALGTSDVGVLELAAAYAPFFADGKRRGADRNRFGHRGREHPRLRPPFA